MLSDLPGNFLGNFWEENRFSNEINHILPLS